MGETFKELAPLRTNKKKYDKGYDRIFNNNNKKKKEKNTEPVRYQNDIYPESKTTLKIYEDTKDNNIKDLENQLKEANEALIKIDDWILDTYINRIVREYQKKYKINKENYKC